MKGIRNNEWPEEGIIDQALPRRHALVHAHLHLAVPVHMLTFVLEEGNKKARRLEMLCSSLLSPSLPFVNSGLIFVATAMRLLPPAAVFLS